MSFDNDEDFWGGPKNPPALRFYAGPHVPYTSPTIGYQSGGQILEIKVRQQFDYETKQPKIWENSGKPMMQAEVILATNLREGPDDDGQRTLYVQGQMKQAVTVAVLAAGDTSGKPKPGGWLKLWCTSTYDEVNRKKKNTWQAQYKIDSLPNQQTDEFFGQNGQTGQSAQTQPTQAYSQTTSPEESAPRGGMLQQLRESAEANRAAQTQQGPIPF
jgi:hypothetical protein